LRAGDETVQPLSDSHADTYKWGLKRFVDEARTLAQFRHPNIVLVHSVFEANNTAYIVMEYQNGQNLDAAYRAGRISTEDELKTLLRALMDGVEIVHAEGFVHRDIKPANIYLKEHDVPVLLDFGSARQALGMETQTLTAMVSPGYAPFEQYNASRDQDNQGPWTDIYALGCTIYRGISGKSHADALMLARDRLEGKAQTETPATIAGEGRFDPQFLAGIDASMNFKPEQRPQSIMQWREMLGFSPPAVTHTASAAAIAPSEPVSQDDIATLVTGPTEVAAALNDPRLAPATAEPDAPSAPPATTASGAPAAQVTQSDPASSKSKPWPLIAGAAVVALGGLFFLLSGGDKEPAKPTADTVKQQPTQTAATPAPAPAAVKTIDPDNVAKIAGEAKCGQISTSIDNRRIIVKGASINAEATRMTAALADIGDVDSSALKIYPDSYCEVVSALAPFADPATATRVTTTSADNALVEGDRLVLEASSDSAELNHLYIDYFTLDGNVVHLLSDSSEQANQIPRGQTVVLGEEGDIERWDIAPPFGQELITIVSSSKPLFEARDSIEAEDAARYLDLLNERIAALRGDGAQITTSDVLITTRAK